MGLKYKKRRKRRSVKKYKVKTKIKDTGKVKDCSGKVFLEPDYRFKNNEEKWITILLNETCELLQSYKIVEKELEEIFGEDVIYFLPLYIEKNDSNAIFQLFEGYIFVKCTVTACENSFKKTDHLDRILYKGSNPSFVTNRDINKFKTKLKLELVKRLPRKGSMILAKEGPFKNQEGRVISVNRKKKTAVIEFHKRTRIVTARLSVINFESI
jgi:transcription antitermination factor NusG